MFVSAHSWFACYSRYFSYKLLLELLWITLDYLRGLCVLNLDCALDFT